MKIKELLIVVLLLLFAFALVSCNPENDVDAPSTGYAPPGNTTVKFPDAINQKTFKIESSADTSSGVTYSTDKNDYYYITTDDTKVTVDACVGSQLTSFTTDVNITIDNNICTATTSDDSTYTFTINSNTLPNITVNNTADPTFDITSSTVEEITRPNNWTLEFKKYEGLSESKSGAMRMMVTPIGVYIAVTYNYATSSEESPTEKDFNWDTIKDAQFFRYDTITETSKGHFEIDDGTAYKHTIDVEEGGYKVFHNTGIGEAMAKNHTFNVKESNNYGASFFFSTSIQSYFTSSSGE